MPDDFQLDPRLADASLPFAETDGCLIRMMNDRRYPWLLVVPRRPGAFELFDLSAEERHHLVDLAASLGRTLAAAFSPDKINVGALGNRVRQLHLHIIARRDGDAAWPDAVWNGTPGQAYAPEERDAALQRITSCLDPSLGLTFDKGAAA